AAGPRAVLVDQHQPLLRRQQRSASQRNERQQKVFRIFHSAVVGWFRCSFRNRCRVRKPSNRDPIASKNAAKPAARTPQLLPIGASVIGATKAKVKIKTTSTT